MSAYDPAEIRGRLPILKGLQAWYDASDLSTITASAGAVSAWADKSGNGFTLTEATNRPTTGTRSQNGLNVIDFDGTNDLLSSSCPVDDNTATTFVVALIDNVAASQRTIYGANGNGGESLRTLVTSGFLTLASQGVGNILAPSLAIAIASPFIAMARMNQGVGVAVATHATISAQVTLAQSFTSGRTLVVGMAASIQPLDGWIGEIVRYSRSLTHFESGMVLDYLADKWGIPLT